MSVKILVGDCRETLRELPDASVDSVVCDPPYHLTSIVKRFGSETAAPAKSNQTGVYARSSKGFMGQKWDGGDVAFQPETWAEVLRVLKPGGHMVAFSGTRTYHRMVVAIEDAGFEIRDQLAWIYGSGFPKSLDVSKQIDKAAGAEREVVGILTAPATEAARKWQGWGTALKPAWEPICLARKPLVGTVAANVLAHGTGALNIDGCRIEGKAPTTFRGANALGQGSGWNKTNLREPQIVGPHPLGRWPANLCHDGSDEVLAGFPESEGGAAGGQSTAASMGYGSKGSALNERVRTFDSGSAARFFYCAKTTTEERGEGNNHPTVKPVTLMRWLCRLITPPGGTILDPFMGSGSTMIAADAEQFNTIGCELSPEYADIAERRLRASAGMFADIGRAA